MLPTTRCSPSPLAIASVATARPQQGRRWRRERHQSLRLAIVLGLTLMACGAGAEDGGNPLRSESPGEQVTTTQPTTPRATAPVSRRPASIRDWRFSVSFKDGSSASVTVNQSAPDSVAALRQRLGPDIPTRFEDPGFRGICYGVSTEKDLFVPIRLSVRNTTQGFSLPIFVALAFGSNRSATGAFAGTQFGLCTIQVDQVSLASGAEVVETGYAVVRNYYSPAAPAGDSSVFEAIRMGLRLSAPRTKVESWTREAGPHLDDCPFVSPFECLPLAAG